MIFNEFIRDKKMAELRWNLTSFESFPFLKFWQISGASQNGGKGFKFIFRLGNKKKNIPSRKAKNPVAGEKISIYLPSNFSTGIKDFEITSFSKKSDS